MECGSCGTRNRTSARFCDRCGSVLLPAEPVRKVVSVVFGDLVGSTALQERLDPESAARLMGRFYAAMRETAARYGGQVEKFIGDGVVVVFGADHSEEDDALRATRCAAAMVRATDDLGDDLEGGWGVRPRMRAGLCTGELVVRRGAELVGDTMNVSARLEQSAGPGEVLLGERTWRLVRHLVRLEAVPPLTVRGKSAPLRAWRLVSLSAPPGGPEVEAPLVGRAAPLAWLRAAFDEVARTGRPRLVAVIGAPGVGKTRLLREFRAGLPCGTQCLETRCEPAETGPACRALLERVRALSGQDPAAPAPGPSNPDPVASAPGPSVLRAAEGERPVVLLLDDVHWAAAPVMRALSGLVDPAAGRPVLVVATARPRIRDLAAGLGIPEGADEIDLRPLGDADARRLIDHLLGAGPPERLLDRMVGVSDGNPLYLTELARYLVEEGVLVRDGDRWRYPENAGPLPVPPGMRQLVVARLERLEAAERAVLERAAVIGPVFGRPDLEALLEHDLLAGLPERLGRLLRRELIEIDEGEPGVYRFASEIVKDGAYGLLLKETRAELHERYARWLSEGAGRGRPGSAELAEAHRRRARRYRRQLGPTEAERAPVTGCSGASFS